jgi:hypothetical protein
MFATGEIVEFKKHANSNLTYIGRIVGYSTDGYPQVELLEASWESEGVFHDWSNSITSIIDPVFIVSHGVPDEE